MATVYCPACEEELELDDAYRDWTVRCPHCGREFVPTDPGRGRDERAEEEEFDDDYVYGYQGGAREEALAVVKGPGLALELTGWATVVLTAIGALIAVVATLSDRNADTEGMLCVGCCAAAFLLPYSLAVALGGRHMRHLTSRGWAMTAAIMSVLAIPLGGCLGVVHGGLGIWALVALEKPVVRRAFGMPDRNRRRWD
jgi:hypothetical protein